MVGEYGTEKESRNQRMTLQQNWVRQEISTPLEDVKLKI